MVGHFLQKTGKLTVCQIKTAINPPFGNKCPVNCDDPVKHTASLNLGLWAGPPEVIPEESQSPAY